MEINAHMVTCALRLWKINGVYRERYMWKKINLVVNDVMVIKSHFWFKSLCVTGLSKLLTVIVSE